MGEDNTHTHKTCSLVHGHCGEPMQMRLENDAKFDTEVQGQPFDMKQMIKLKMHDPSKVKHPHATLFEQLEHLLGAKQEDEEVLLEHTKCFKQAQDNVKSPLEMIQLHKFMDTTVECSGESDQQSNKN